MLYADKQYWVAFNVKVRYTVILSDNHILSYFLSFKVTTKFTWKTQMCTAVMLTQLLYQGYYMQEYEWPESDVASLQITS